VFRIFRLEKSMGYGFSVSYKCMYANAVVKIGAHVGPDPL
jgi:hypothetical protein